MKLALACGRADVDRFLSELSSEQLTEWMAYEQLEGPIDLARRIDTSAAAIQATIANVNRNPKRKRAPYKIKDFLPKWGKPAQSPEEMMRSFGRRFGRR